jgi:hypothetical protein
MFFDLPGLLDRHPADTSVAIHPIRQPLFTISKRASLPAADSPQLDAKRCRQKTAERKTQCRAFSIATKVISNSPAKRLSTWP